MGKSEIEIRDHKISTAEWCCSPNCNQRPDLEDISLIVIHCISLPPGEFGGKAISQLFLNQLDCSEHAYYEELRDLEVSAHVLIRRDGQIVQYVPFDQRAWHAGVSSFQGRSGCNDFSIGIELEGTESTPFKDEQYGSLINLLAALYQEYPKTSKNGIVGHSDIAPGRKTDPGSCFDWKRLAKAGFHRSCDIARD